MTHYYGIHVLEPLEIEEDAKVHTFSKSEVHQVYETVNENLIFVTFFAALNELQMKDMPLISVRRVPNAPHRGERPNVMNLRSLVFDNLWIEFGGVFLPNKSIYKGKKRRLFIKQYCSDEPYNFVKYGEERKVVLNTTGVNVGSYFNEDIPAQADKTNPMDDSNSYFHVSCIVIKNLKMGVAFRHRRGTNNHNLCKYFIASGSTFGYGLWYCTSNDKDFRPANLPKIRSFYHHEFEYSTPENNKVSATLMT